MITFIGLLPCGRREEDDHDGSRNSAFRGKVGWLDISPFVQGGRHIQPCGKAVIGRSFLVGRSGIRARGMSTQCLDAEPSLTGVLKTSGPGWKGGSMAPAVWAYP